MIREKKVTHCA